MASGNVNMNGATIQGKTVTVKNNVTGYGGSDGTIQAENVSLTGDCVNIINNVESKGIRSIDTADSQGAKADTAIKRKTLLERISSFIEEVLAGVITNMITK